MRKSESHANGKRNGAPAVGTAMTHAEIGKRLGISRSTARDLEKSAMKKLRRSPLLMLLYMESLDPRRRSGNVGTLTREEAFADDPDLHGIEQMRKWGRTA